MEPSRLPFKPLEEYTPEELELLMNRKMIIPRRYNQPPPSSEKFWKDDNVYEHLEHSFTCLPIEKAVELCKKWWTFYNGSPHHDSSTLNTFIALHMVDPNSQGSYLLEIPSPSATLKENDSFKPLLSSTEETKGDTNALNFPAKCHEYDVLYFNNWYCSLSRVNQVAFTAYLAASLCRMKTKNADHLKHYIRNLAMDEFVRIYHRAPNGLKVPLPRGRFLAENSAFSGICLDATFLSRVLIVYKLAKVDPSRKAVASLLEKSILNPTKNNGMKLVTMAIDAASELGIDVQELLDIIRELVPTVEESVDHLTKFFKGSYKTRLWPWCRLLQNQYHFMLQVDDNKTLTAIFAGLLGPTGKESIWSFHSLKSMDLKDRGLHYANIVRRASLNHSASNSRLVN